MIVMKFGGSSLATAASLSRAVSIIRSEAARHPVIVASAMGDTTDTLLDVLTAARRGNSYTAWKYQEAIKDHHFSVCQELLEGSERILMDRYLQTVFRDLHVRMLELCEGERTFTPELQDWTVSLGEQLSSQVLAAVLQQHCENTIHLDSRQLILTNDAWTNAQPRYWESYARIRWAVPIAARDKLVVLGGFIGSTEDGRTTTLGRGGSDLTASIVGAAINAEEIQVWKDVDGMLTCDPRLRQGNCRVKKLSYDEATELAHAGATILHPETMVPAQRLGIPIVIRNTFRPAGDGTRIGNSDNPGTTQLKSIAVKKDITLLEVRPGAQANAMESLVAFCNGADSGATVLSSSEQAVYIAVDEHAKVPDQAGLPNGCLEVKIRTHQAILTLVGQISSPRTILAKLNSALAGSAAFIVPKEISPCSVTLAVPQGELTKYLDLLHQTFFTNPDPACFTVENAPEAPRKIAEQPAQKRLENMVSFVPNTSLYLPN